MIERKDLCKETVWHNLLVSQCRNKANEDGYCIIHCPTAVAKRKTKQDERYQQYKQQLEERRKKAEVEQKLIAFARWAIDASREYGGCDIDGGSIEDKMEELGLLERIEVQEPCGEGCLCVEYYGEFPAECLRLVDGVKEGG